MGALPDAKHKKAERENEFHRNPYSSAARKDEIIKTGGKAILWDNKI
jgi:hypothetical protein